MNEHPGDDDIVVESALAVDKWRSPAWLVGLSEVVVRSAIVLVGFVVVGWVAIRFRVVVVPMFIALLVATVLTPAVGWMRRHRFSPLAATASVLGAAGLIVTGGVAVLSRLVRPELDDLDTQVRSGVVEVEDWLRTGPLGIDDVSVTEIWDRFRDQLVSGEDARIIEGITLVTEVAAGMVLAVVFVFFILKDGPGFAQQVRGRLPTERRDRLVAAATAAWRTLGAYVRGTMIVGVVNGTVIGLALAILGIPLVVPLAVITSLSAFFPLIGAIVAGTLSALVALVSGGPTDAIIVVAVTIVVQQIEGNVLSPILLGRALRLHPLVIVVSVSIGAISAGVLGAFVAVPLVATATSSILAARAVRGRHVGDAAPNALCPVVPEPTLSPELTTN